MQGCTRRIVERTATQTTRRTKAARSCKLRKRRALAAGLPYSTCCHTFRATGITAYLENGDTIENDQPYYLLCRNLFGLVAA